MLRGDANENSQKKNKLLRSDAAHFCFCCLSCLKTMQKSVERAKKKKEKSLQKQDVNTTQIHEINLIQNRRKLS